MLARIGQFDNSSTWLNGSTLCIPYFLISHYTLCSYVFLGLNLQPPTLFDRIAMLLRTSNFIRIKFKKWAEQYIFVNQ